jgi:hypothetical protein
MSDQPEPNSEFILYQTEDGRTRIQCRFENETVLLTQRLMAELFRNLHPASPTGRGGAGAIRNFRIDQFTTLRRLKP